MPSEPLSPELVLVDPELGARARAALPDRLPQPPSPREMASVVAAHAPSGHRRVRYPFWARVTALLWVLVIGILIGGAAIPHAQDRPHVVPPEEDVTICEREPPSTLPTRPLNPFGNP